MAMNVTQSVKGKKRQSQNKIRLTALDSIKSDRKVHKGQVTEICSVIL